MAVKRGDAVNEIPILWSWVDVARNLMHHEGTSVSQSLHSKPDVNAQAAGLDNSPEERSEHY